MILVAGGTGRLGTVVVRRLTEAGHPVRVLTREPGRAAHLTGAGSGAGAEVGVEVVRGDVRDADSVRSSMYGVDTVISAVHGLVGPGRVSPASVDRDGNANLVEACQQAGSALVLVSVVGAAADHRLELFRMKAAAEQVVRRSGLAWSIVRATAFAELYLDLLHRSAGRSGRPMVFGRGENPINFVSVADVADGVLRAAQEPVLRGRTLEVAGPAELTFQELAELSVAGSGGQGVAGGAQRPPRHLPRTALRIVRASGRVLPSSAARQAGAALFMDTADMRFRPDPTCLSLIGAPVGAVGSPADRRRDGLDPSLRLPVTDR